MERKLMIVTGALSAGGVEKVTSLIANWYVKNGWEVKIVCLLYFEKKIFVHLNENVSVDFIDMGKKENSFNKALYSFVWIKKLKSIITIYNPNSILAMTLKIAALCSLARGNKTNRLVLREINDPKCSARNRFIDSMLFVLCKKVDGIIFQTNWEKECYPKWISKKGEVIPNPISVKVQSTGERKREIVTMGRLNNVQKNHKELLGGFKLFLQRHNDYILKIYGDGPDLNEDEKYASELGISDKVSFCGAQKDVHEKIKDASVFVMTSIYEGLSNALVESLLIGVPCVSSDWPGVEDVISNGYNGFIYERGNIEELSEKLSLLVENNDLSCQFVKNATADKNKYDPDTILLRYAKVING